MKTICIVGGGPGGLSAAIYLRKKLDELGLNDISITVIDPRLDEYTRPGLIDQVRFFDLSDNLGETVAPSKTGIGMGHIKDIERSLYAIAQSLNIKFEKASFEGFEGKAIRIKTTNGEEKTLPCDVVLDATGPKRAVVNEVKKVEPNSFHIQPIDNAPVKDHLIAYVKISKYDRSAVSFAKHFAQSMSTALHVQTLEEIRAMGWQGFVAPTFHFQLLHKDKVCFYVEIPPDLDPTKYEEWLKKVVVLNTGKTDFTFKQIPYDPDKNKADKRKVRFGKFSVDPLKVEEDYCKGKDLPDVIPIADAKIEPDYRLGIGIETADEINKKLRDAFAVDPNNSKEFTIDFISFEEEIKNIIANHEEQISNYYAGKRDNLVKTLIEEKNNYAKVIKGSLLSLSSLHPSYRELVLSLASLLKRDAVDNLTNALNDDGTIKTDNYGLIQEEVAIEESIKVFERLLKMLPKNSTELQLIQEELKAIALKYKELGIEFYNRNKFGSSMRCYSKALSILQNNLSDSEQRNILILQSNCVVALCKAADYERAINLADDTLNILNQALMPDKDKLLSKIIFHKTVAMIHVAERLENTEKRSSMLAECKQNLEILKCDPNVGSLELKKALKLVEEIKEEKYQMTKGFLL